MPMKDLSPCVTSPLAIVKVAKEIDATKKERRGMCREERTLRDGREEKEEEESEGAEGGRKIPVRGWKRMLATNTQSGRPGTRTV